MTKDTLPCYNAFDKDLNDKDLNDKEKIWMIQKEVNDKERNEY